MKKDRRLTDTKEKLFMTALDLFAGKGVDATSIRDIVNRLGISTAAFYNHFKSKDALLQALYDFYNEKFIQPASVPVGDYEDLADTMDPVQIFTGLVNQFQKVLKNPVLEKLSRIIIMEKEKNTIAAEISFKDRQRLIHSMESLFTAFKKKGYIKTGDPHLLGRMFAYIQLGIFVDNSYYKYIKHLDTDEIIKMQNEMLIQFLKILLTL